MKTQPIAERRRGRSSALKRLVLGRPIATERAQHELLPKLLALPVFASDALSSNAYATQEILLVLAAAGSAALSRSIPIALAVSALLVIVVVSYRQTVRAYPSGGGAYIVAKENLGELPGLVAAASLLVDYVLTVAVSIAAAAFALGSLQPSLLDQRVPLSLAAIGVVTVMNLRGARESGTLFAIPTYGFILSVFATLAVGFARCTLDACPQATAPPLEHGEVQAISLWLILRAFSSGSTALTGVEAIANGVPAFAGRRPAHQARNAATTLGMLAAISVTMFVGLTVLADRMHAIPSEEKSVVAQVADAAFGGGAGFIIVQVATALILVLAANTAYQDFPRLSSVLARDRFMPRQFINRGDRLVFSNGIIVLAALACVLIVAFDANVNNLIQLYVVGVFTSFTLSQLGMVRHWRGEGLRMRSRPVLLNLVGGVTTGVVLVVVGVTKFPHGAWMVVVAVPVIVALFKAIQRHYASVAAQLRVPGDAPRRLAGTRAVLLVARIDAPTLRALGYARSLRPLDVHAVHVGRGPRATELADAWRARAGGTRLEVVDGDADQPLEAIRVYLRALAAAEDQVITVVMPEVVFAGRFRHLVRRRRALLLKASLLFEPRIALTDYTVLEDRALLGGDRPVEPTRVVAVVLVSAVHNATLRALEYARSLRPTELRALTLNVDPGETAQVLRAWAESVDDVPLEAIESPYREVTRPLRRYVHRLRKRMPDATVSVILPEFVVRKYWHQFLHNQTALAIKGTLLFEPGVVVTSVPYHLE